MQIKVGEYSTGACKGFKYYYPELEERDVNFTPKEYQEMMGEKNPSDFVFQNQKDILYILNRALKEEYSRHISDTVAPLAKLGKGMTKEQVQVVGESLARLHPDGFLNTPESVTTNPPWKRAS